MSYKPFLAALIALLFSFSPVYSQSQRKAYEEYKAKQQREFNKNKDARKQEFNDYKETKRREYEAFRRKCNEEYAKFMREAWKTVEPSPVIPEPEDDPVPPVVKPPVEEIPAPTPRRLPIDEIIPAPIPQPQPQPIVPIEEIRPTPEPIPAPSPSPLPVPGPTPVPDPVPIPTPVPEPSPEPEPEPAPAPAPAPILEPSVSFTYFGTNDKVRYDDGHAIKIGTLNENNIANAWLKLSDEAYTNLIYDCLKIRKDRELCDWAYLVMLDNMSQAVFGKDTNEATLLMAYVYCQSGYKMRLGMNNGRLYLLYGSKYIIYNKFNYMMGGEHYYVYGPCAEDIQICNQQYPKEQSMSLLVTTEQKFDMASVNSTPHKSERNPEMNVSMSANQNMLDFYTSYPTSMIGDNHLTRWAMYANAPVPEYVKQQVYPQLRSAISGCSQIEAVTKILNMVQTGFQYEYDDKVWGSDRAFFPEESMHYKYCDCEDRAILIASLARDLLGLKSILIYYPGHLAAGVCITEGEPTGDYIEVDGKRYFLTDGAILYATSLGKTMPTMDNSTAKVILLD